MKGLLEFNPKKRLNGVTIFEHPYLDKFVEKDMKKNNDKIADANDKISNNNLNNNGNNSNTNIII